MPLAEVAADLARLERDSAIYKERNFAARAEALDYLEFHIIDRLASLGLGAGVASDRLTLQARATQLKQQLEAVDTALFRRLRTEIRAGHYRGAAFRALVEHYVGSTASSPAQAPPAGYDVLDDFTNGLFPLPELPLETAAGEPDMVHYQKTPARLVFELVEKAALVDDDVFVDVGAGLGHVPLLVALLCGVAAQGIEVEPAYCEIAAGWAADLGLSQVSFWQADARQADYSSGTVFYLYTPFSGRMLMEVLARLRAESERRRITLFTYGPCTLQVAQQPWLRVVGASEITADRLARFES